MQLFKLTAFLNNYLDNEKYKDYSVNGLQVENNEVINKIYVAVDANLYTIQQCAPDSLLFVHHGLFWGKSFPITGGDYDKLSFLIKNNIALYASHLPLDGHREIGNNALLLKGINAEITGPFAEYNGQSIGFQGFLENETDILYVEQRLKDLIGSSVKVFNFSGKKKIRSICAVSGNAGMDVLEQFKNSNIDLLVTGESSHVLVNYIEDHKLDVMCGGHYATEALGVMALGKIAAREFLLDWEFIEHPTGE